MDEVYVLSSWLGSCLKGFQLRDWNQTEILDVAAVDPSIFSKQYCTHNHVYDLFRAAEKLHGTSVGLESRRGIVPNSFSSLSLAMLAAENLSAGLGLMVKYSAMVTNAYDCYLDEDVANPVFGFKLCSELEIPPMVSDAIISTAVRTFRFVQPQHNAILQIDLARPRPKDTLQYERYFKAPIHWGSKQFAIHLSSDCLALPSMHAHPELLEYNENKCIEKVQELESSSLLFSVKKYLRDNLEQEGVSIEKAAESLKIGIRSMQRSLRADGTSFKHLLDEMRQLEAQKYIETTPLSITQIAHSLGFSDAGNFTRAFKRWFNCSPNQYRQRTSQKITSAI